ncbi:unnamed protein product [Plutella xylostella]|uniref:(diamondback moth) hypothetical protein n=1 Tax=Plutella xylostella TaxID=51655 RepID=A0A8S4DT60_PLUXY|nr:unnamed protein product [Plutella xylostella]
MSWAGGTISASKIESLQPLSVIAYSSDVAMERCLIRRLCPRSCRSSVSTDSESSDQKADNNQVSRPQSVCYCSIKGYQTETVSA